MNKHEKQYQQLEDPAIFNREHFHWPKLKNAEIGGSLGLRMLKIKLPLILMPFSAYDFSTLHFNGNHLRNPFVRHCYFIIFYIFHIFERFQR
jgi:hypothetical protein